MSKQELITYISELFSRANDETLPPDINDQFKIFCINNISLFENKQNIETIANLRDFLDKIKNARHALSKAILNGKLNSKPSKNTVTTATTATTATTTITITEPTIPQTKNQVEYESEHVVNNKKIKPQLL
jgi:hypothetical protein